MTDEEKKAIEWVKNNLKETIKLGQKYGLQEAIKEQTIILNLIEKQSKEIEELKQEKEYLNCIIESDKDNYINKDKIKAKIEEVENMTLVEIAEKVEGHTYYLSLDGLSEGKKIASYFIQSLLEEKE